MKSFSRISLPDAPLRFVLCARATPISEGSQPLAHICRLTKPEPPNMSVASLLDVLYDGRAPEPLALAPRGLRRGSVNRSSRPEHHPLEKKPSVARTNSYSSGTPLTHLDGDVYLPFIRDRPKEHPFIDFSVVDNYIARTRVEPSRTRDRYTPLSSRLLYVDIPMRFAFLKGHQDTVHAPDLASLVTPGQLFSLLFAPEPGAPWWLDCTCPNDDEMKTICQAFGIHPLTAEDIRMKEPREKVELFRHYYFVCFNSFEQDRELENYLDQINVYIVVFAEGVLTFHYTTLSHPPQVRRRIRQLSDYVDVLADWICYALIDDIVDAFIPVIDGIEYEADLIEDGVFVLRETDFQLMLSRIGMLRRKVMLLMRLLANKADVIKMFAKRYQEKQHLWHRYELTQHLGEIALYLGDIQDHVLTMFQNLGSYEKIFSRSHANYLAQLLVMSLDGNRKLNKIFTTITLLATVIVPLHVMTGLFGMNVTVPGEGIKNLHWWFGILGVAIAAMLIFMGVGYQWSRPYRQALLSGGSGRSLRQLNHTFARIRRRGVVAEAKLIILSWTNDS